MVFRKILASSVFFISMAFGADAISCEADNTYLHEKAFQSVSIPALGFVKVFADGETAFSINVAGDYFFVDVFTYENDFPQIKHKYIYDARRETLSQVN